MNEFERKLIIDVQTLKSVVMKLKLRIKKLEGECHAKSGN